MMPTSTTTIVRALEPTILGTRAEYELRDTDLFLPVSISTAIVVPGAVDAERLKYALARALAIYPLYAGRVEKRDRRWLVRLSNEGALFDVVISESEEPPLTADAPIVQAPFTLTQPIDCSYLYSGFSSKPLLRITLTRGPSSRWSAVGFSSSHVVGDGCTLRGFMRTLSRFYLCLEPLIEDVPVYDYPPNARASAEEMAAIQPQTLQTPLTGVPCACARVDLRLGAQKLLDLRNGVMGRCPDGVVLEVLSTQDCLVGALADAISRTYLKHGAAPMTRVTTVFNYRGVGPIPRTAACNALIRATADLTPSTSIGSPPYAYELSSSIRRSLIAARSYDNHTRVNIAACGLKFLHAAENNVASDFSSPEGEMIVNSTRHFEWTAAHFGYEGKARFFHTVINRPRYVKIFTPNPTPSCGDSEWKQHKCAAEVVFYIETHMKADFVDDFRAVVAELGVHTEVDFVVT